MVAGGGPRARRESSRKTSQRWAARWGLRRFVRRCETVSPARRPSPYVAGCCFVEVVLWRDDGPRRGRLSCWAIHPADAARTSCTSGAAWTRRLTLHGGLHVPSDTGYRLRTFGGYTMTVHASRAVRPGYRRRGGRTRSCGRHCRSGHGAGIASRAFDRPGCAVVFGARIGQPALTGFPQHRDRRDPAGSAWRRPAGLHSSITTCLQVARRGAPAPRRRRGASPQVRQFAGSEGKVPSVVSSAAFASAAEPVPLGAPGAAGPLAALGADTVGEVPRPAEAARQRRVAAGRGGGVVPDGERVIAADDGEDVASPAVDPEGSGDGGAHAALLALGTGVGAGIASRARELVEFFLGLARAAVRSARVWRAWPSVASFSATGASSPGRCARPGIVSRRGAARWLRWSPRSGRRV